MHQNYINAKTGRHYDCNKIEEICTSAVMLSNSFTTSVNFPTSSSSSEAAISCQKAQSEVTTCWQLTKSSLLVYKDYAYTRVQDKLNERTKVQVILIKILLANNPKLSCFLYYSYSPLRIYTPLFLRKLDPTPVEYNYVTFLKDKRVQHENSKSQS